MSRIAVLITHLFEDSEYTEPAEAFKDANHDLVHLGLKKEEVIGKHGAVVDIDELISQADPSAFDAMFIPGGFSPDQLRANNDAVRFVRTFAMSQKPMLVICHGPQLLISAQVLDGRTVTGYVSIVQDLINAGAHYIDSPVVVDGALVSSRNPKDIPAFIDSSLEVLASYQNIDSGAEEGLA